MPRTKDAYRQIRDKRKQQILDTAAVVFAQKGLSSTKISDLAGAAGVSQGLLYRYFSDKEDVFAALVERAVHHAIQRAQTALESPETPWEKLRSLTEEFLQGMSRKPMYYQIFLQAFALSGKVHEIVEELEKLIVALRQLIVDGQAAGQISSRDPDQLVLLYLCCLYGLAAGMSLSHRGLAAHFPDAGAVLQILKP
jgi:AcrR family transcriptional regulator